MQSSCSIFLFLCLCVFPGGSTERLQALRPKKCWKPVASTAAFWLDPAKKTWEISPCLSGNNVRLDAPNGSSSVWLSSSLEPTLRLCCNHAHLSNHKVEHTWYHSFFGGFFLLNFFFNVTLLVILVSWLQRWWYVAQLWSNTLILFLGQNSVSINQSVLVLRIRWKKSQKFFSYLWEKNKTRKMFY